MAKPYIFKMATYVLSDTEINEICDYLEDKDIPYGYREICDNADAYCEFDVGEVGDETLPVIGKVKDLGVDVIQVWNDK